MQSLQTTLRIINPYETTQELATDLALVVVARLLRQSDALRVEEAQADDALKGRDEAHGRQTADRADVIAQPTGRGTREEYINPHHLCTQLQYSNTLLQDLLYVI